MKPLAVRLDQCHPVGIGEVESADQFTSCIENLKLGIGHRMGRQRHHTSEEVFERALGDAVPREPVFDKWSDGSNAPPAAFGDPCDETANIPCGEQFVAQSGIETLLHIPGWSRCSEVNNGSYGRRGWDAVDFNDVGLQEIKRLVHDEWDPFAASISTGDYLGLVGLPGCHPPKVCRSLV